MKNTFNNWEKIAKMDIDSVTNYILTGHKASTAKPDIWILNIIGKEDKPMTILDFGCGIGRNTLGLAKINQKWNIVGYDSENIISRVPEFVDINYNGIMPSNVQFVSDWNQLKTTKFDKIIAVIVLQHIMEKVLIEYIRDFKNMTNFLCVSGRRFNDDVKKRSTWTIIEEQGLIPSKFYKGHIPIIYSPLGDPNEHNIACYHL
jgi:ribosomal protein L11 methylase PrmA